MALQLAAGVGPDLIFVCNTVNFPEFAAAGYLVPLDDYIEASGLDTSDYVQDALERYEGQLYHLPDSFHNGVSILYYNKTMFDEEGLDYPNEEWTYDDVVTAAAELTKDTDGDGEIDQFGWVPLNFSRNVAENASFMRSFGCTWLDETMTQSQADDPACLQAVQFVVDHLDVAPPYDSTRARDDYFTSGQVAMLIQGPWVLEGYRASLESIDMEVGTTKIPTGPAGRLSAGAAYGAHGITSMCEHPDEAYKFVEWITNEENIKDFAALNLSQPARLSALETWVENFPLEAPAAAAVDYSAPPMNTPANLRKAEMSSLISSTLEGVWIGDKTPEEALAELHEMLQELLDQPAP
jgi:multiple sugar transport system substrate-binding protein